MILPSAAGWGLLAVVTFLITGVVYLVASRPPAPSLLDPEVIAFNLEMKARREAQKKNKRGRAEILNDSPLLQRAIAVTAGLADRRGILGKIERKMRSGDLPVRPAEAIFFYVAAVVIGAPIVLLAFGLSKIGLVLLLLVLFGPILFLNLYVKRRLKKFSDQLPDMLIGLASSLRAGRSVGQAMELLSREVPDPMGRELRKIVAETKLGWPLVSTLTDAAERIGSNEFAWAVMAMKIQAEVGGNLAELLDQVADTMRERSRFKGEVKALTAEGRASALLLVFMPPALVLVMRVMNPDYIAVLFNSGTGKFILGLSVAMIVVGYFVMMKVITIEA
jgi:tight adherence protein B